MIEALAVRIKTIEQRLARVERAEVPFYAKGTWTPVVQGATTAGTGTYTTQTGLYTRVGRAIHVTAWVVWSAHTGTGQLQLVGLPLVSANIANAFWAVSVFQRGIATTGVLQGYVVPNSTAINFEQVSTAGASTTIAVPASGSLMITTTYTV